MGIKERRSKLLLAFSLLGGIAFKPVTLNEKFLRVFDLSMNQKTKSTLQSLLKKGAIVEKETGKNKYELTEVGYTELSLDFPYFRFFYQPWDGKWRVLSYEIPEAKRELRDRLRRHVAGWGLGPWHRSFWLTPHPITSYLEELVSGKEEQQYIQAFESTHVFGDKSVLIEKVWGKVQLHAAYKGLFKVWHDLLSKDMDKLDKFTLIVKSYVAVLRNDPGLPEELLGKDWIGFEALELFGEIRDILFTQD